MWVAYYRALEAERPRPLVTDPFAKELAGERGKQMAMRMAGRGDAVAVMAARTYVIDEWVKAAVREGVDTVYDLAAGLDTRPYRLDLPPSVRWIDVDLPPMLAYKEAKLKAATPRCRLERVPLDLADERARAGLFASATGKAFVITEGLLPYLSEEAVAQLAQELKAQPAFRLWCFDYIGVRAIKYLQARWGAELSRLNAPIIWATPGAGWFERHGWQVREEKAMPLELKRLGRDRPAMVLARALARLRGVTDESVLARVFGGLALLQRP
jgi:methyltransferase (TIGR00027 family)